MKIKLIVCGLLATLCLTNCKEESKLVGKKNLNYVSFKSATQVIAVKPANLLEVGIEANTDIVFVGDQLVYFTPIGVTIDAQESTAIQGVHFNLYGDNALLYKHLKENQLFFDVMPKTITKPLTIVFKLTDLGDFSNPNKLPIIDKITVTLTPEK